LPQMTENPQNHSLQASASFASVAEKNTFDVQKFRQDSETFSKLFREAVEELVESANRKWIQSNTTLQEILNEYKQLLYDSRSLSNEFINNTTSMQAFLNQWKELVLKESSYFNLDQWIQHSLKFNEKQSSSIVKILEKEEISDINALIYFSAEDPENFQKMTETIPIGIRKRFTNEVTILCEKHSETQRAEFISKLKIAMQETMASSKQSKESLIKMGERFTALFDKIQVEKNKAASEATKNMWITIGLAISSAILIAGGIALTCCCPFLVFVEGSILPYALYGLIGAFAVSAVAAVSATQRMKKIASDLRTIADTYGKLSQKNSNGGESLERSKSAL